MRVEATWAASLAPHLARTCTRPGRARRCGCYASEIKYRLAIRLFRVRTGALGFDVVAAVLVGIRWALFVEIDHLVAFTMGLIAFSAGEAKELPVKWTFEELIGLSR